MWDLTRGWGCCGGNPLLLKTDAGPAIRPCDDTPQRAGAVARYAAHSAPSCLLRAVADHSLFVRHLMGLMRTAAEKAITRRAPDTYTEDLESLVAVMTAIQQRVVARRIDFVIVLAPYRETLHSNDRQAQTRLQRAASLLTDAGIRVLNASEAFAESATRHPLRSLFLGNARTAPMASI